MPSENQYRVSYDYGYVEFHSNRNNESLTFSYKGTGGYYLNVKRIFVLVDSNGDVIETLQSITDSTIIARDDAIQTNTDIQEEESIRVSNENTRQSQESDRQTNTTNAINNLNDAVDTSQLIYKSPVATFNDIITTYPTPELSWVVQTLDDSKYYRYDENSEWIYIQQIQLSQIDTKVSKLGDTMSDYLTLHADPTNPYHASTKQYTDTKLPLSGGDMTGNINMGENEINLGGFKIKHNANLNSIDFEF